MLADPNWAYRHAGGRGAAENHYRTSPTDAIANLPVSKIVADAAVLFLWCTWPIYIDDPESVQKVIRAWGFTPKTIGFVWVKTNKKAGTPFTGGGSWTRANTEFVLLCTRGDIRRIDEGKDTPLGKAARSVHQIVETWDEEDNVLRAPHPDVPKGVSEHSAKPAAVRNKIVQMMGDLPRIELYARERAEGWAAWGDGVPGGSDVSMVQG